MHPVLATLLAFLIYWIILYVACYIIIEYGQTYLYDEATPGLPIKVAIGSFVLALVLTWRRTSFESMFSSDLAFTVGQAILWFLVFTFVFRFHPQHAAAIGVLAFVILAGASTLAIRSMSGEDRSAAAARTPSKPIQRPLGPQLPPGVELKSGQTEPAAATP